MSDQLPVPVVEGTIQKDFNDLPAFGTTAGYLPYLQMAPANCAGKPYRSGDFCLFGQDKDKPEVLGPDFDAIVIDWRPKAMYLVDNKPEIINFDFKSAEFQYIREQSEVLAFGGKLSAMWGGEFLMWIPAAKNGNGAWATYFMASKTARNEAENLRTFLITGTKDTGYRSQVAKIHFHSHLVKKKFTFLVPQCSLTTAVLAPPTPEDLEKTLKTFLNPRSITKEVATGEQRDR